MFRSRDGGAHWTQDARARTRTPARSTSRSSRAIRASSTPRCGRRGGRRGTSIRRRTARAAASTSRPTAARTGPAAPATACPSAPGRIGLAPAPRKPRARLRDRRRASREGGLYRSDDAGATWTQGQRRQAHLASAAGTSAGSPSNPKNADQRLGREHDHAPLGRRRRAFRPGQGRPTGDDYHSCGSIRRTPTGASSASTRATLVTVNGGKTWSTWYNQPTGQFYHVSPTTASRTGSTARSRIPARPAVPSRSDNRHDGITMTQFHEVTAGGESDKIAPDPNDPDIVYGGRVDRLDLQHGPDAQRRSDARLPRRTIAATWTLPLTLRQARSDALYFGNQRLFRTARWRRALDGDQPRPDARGSRRSAEPRCRRPRSDTCEQGAAARRDLRHRAVAADATD